MSWQPCVYIFPGKDVTQNPNQTWAILVPYSTQETTILDTILLRWFLVLDNLFFFFFASWHFSFQNMTYTRMYPISFYGCYRHLCLCAFTCTHRETPLFNHDTDWPAICRFITVFCFTWKPLARTNVNGARFTTTHLRRPRVRSMVFQLSNINIF